MLYNLIRGSLFTQIYYEYILFYSTYPIIRNEVVN